MKENIREKGRCGTIKNSRKADIMEAEARETEKKVWVVSVNMGYGHQRTAYALRQFACGGRIINANDYEGIPPRDRIIWESIQKLYEFISGLYRIPLIGNVLFAIFDKFQKVFRFDPRRDLSKKNSQLKQIHFFLKRGWGQHLIKKLISANEGLGTNLPLLSTFFTPAHMAELFQYPGAIFCVICDSDISRTWGPLNPQDSNIIYFAPTERVVERLKLYGVKPNRIFLTGYPLPLELIGGENMKIAKEDLRHRLLNLDPQKRYVEKQKIFIEETIGMLPESADHILTILFSVGGAGVQKEIGIAILRTFFSQIKAGEIRLILSAGTKEKIKDYFEMNTAKLGVRNNENIEIIFEKNIESYFRKFNLALRKTDILWTKPSELSFYSALGIPIIIAPPIGSHEECNREWLCRSFFGLLQGDPTKKEWFYQYLEQGYFAEAAMRAFLRGEKLGVLRIGEIIRNLGS